MRKVTMNLPASLIDGLAERENKSLTEIVREALKAYRHARAYEALRKMRGKVKFDLNVDELREDRD